MALSRIMLERKVCSHLTWSATLNARDSCLCVEYSEDVKQTYVVVTFYSSNTEIAMAPTCKFPWDYNYLVPKSHSSNESLLPGCWTSAKGQIKVYYWFYILDWKMD